MKKIIALSPVDFSTLITAIENQCTGISCLQVRRAGQTVFKYQSDTLPETQIRPIKSVTKTIITMLLGIIIEQYNKKHPAHPISVDSKLSEIMSKEDLEALQGPANIPNLSLKQVLTMTSGIEWNEEKITYGLDNDIVKLYRSGNPLNYIAQKPIDPEKVGKFQYNGGLTLILSKVMTHLSGQLPEDFARAIFKPLGIECEWIKLKGTPYISYSGGLHLSAESLSKIGQLIAAKGRHGDTQLIPESWMTEMFEPHISQEGLSDAYKNGFSGFGYHAWRNDVITQDEKTYTVWSATGTGGQKIYAFPDHDIVVTMQSDNFDERLSNLTKDEQLILRRQPNRLLKEVIFPIIFGVGAEIIDPDPLPTSETIKGIRKKLGN